MSLSEQARIADVHKGLRLMMAELRDAPFDGLFANGDALPYSELELTTWDELTERGWVTDWGLRRYRFTGAGWRTGVDLLKLTDDPVFSGKMSLLSKTLRGYVTPRPPQDAMRDTFRVQKDTGLDHGFIYNALRTRLLDETFSIKGAYFDPGDANYHVIIIPKGYGHRQLPI